MTDREKVVSEFERCIGLFSPADTSDEYFICVCKRALELLKEQEAVKPIKPIYHGDDSYTCDNCGETVGWEEMACCGIDQVKFKYCPGCGRKVKWDERTH